MSDEIVSVALFAGIASVIAFAAVAWSRRRAGAIRAVLTPIAASAGWSELEPMFLANAGIRGTWRSLPVELAYGARQKSTPQRLTVKVRAVGDSRIAIRRRMYGWLTRPFTLVGPPLVELHHAAARELWVRADEPALAERLFSDDGLASLIATNLVASFDEIRVDRNGLRIRRSLDDRAVRAKYAMPAFTVHFEPERFQPIAREEIALAEALAEKLSRPASR